MQSRPPKGASVASFLLAIGLYAAAGCSHPAPRSSALPSNAVHRTHVYREIDKLTETMLHVRKNYVEEKDYTEIMNGALNGMLQSLDPYSYYLEPKQLKELKEDTSGEYAGIGIVIGIVDGHLAVIAPIEDTPAFNAGLMAQDRILTIEGESTRGITLQDAVKQLRGRPGTKVTITVRRWRETEARPVELVRENIKVPSVKGERILRDGIGYVRIVQFSQPTAQSLENKVEQLVKEGATALILDLRSNPGGLLESAVDVASKFLKRGSLVVETRGRAGATRNGRYTAKGGRRFTRMPIAILINRGSASASEIVAGALRDQGRAVLVGQRTFGKGSVQTIIRLKSDKASAVRLTTAKYYTPSHKEIHKHGIEPDVPVTITPAQWAKIRTRRRHIELPDRYAAEEKEKYKDVVDPQVERAAELLTAIRAYRSRSEKKD